MALEQDLAQFRSIELFRSLEPEALRLMAFSAESRIYNPGESLEAARDGGLLLTRGAVLLHSDAAPRRFVAPALIGEMALIVRDERPPRLVAESSVGGFFISRVLFLRVLGEYPRSAQAVAATIRARLSEIETALAPLGRMGAEGPNPD